MLSKKLIQHTDFPSLIELDEFIEPTNIICKCGPEEICPICEEEKDLTY